MSNTAKQMAAKIHMAGPVLRLRSVANAIEKGRLQFIIDLAAQICAHIDNNAGQLLANIRKRLSAGARVHYNHSGVIMSPAREIRMRQFTAVIERCPETSLYVGYIPGFPGAHSQGETLEELNHNLAEVIAMLLEDGEPVLESEFVGTQAVQVS